MNNLNYIAAIKRCRFSITFVLSLVLLSMAACSFSQPVKNYSSLGPSPTGMPGGWSKASIDMHIEQVANFATPYTDQAPLDRVIEARTQVVAGINYWLLLKMENGQLWQAKVYKNLQGKLTFISLKKAP